MLLPTRGLARGPGAKAAALPTAGVALRLGSAGSRAVAPLSAPPASKG